jgi:hypothetical protein
LRGREGELIEWMGAFSEREFAHFAFDATGIAFPATSDGTSGGDFLEDAIEPGGALLRGE